MAGDDVVGSVRFATMANPLRQWLLLATAALTLAGLLSILVAAARVPALEPLAGKSYFYAALVGHVDFSLVVWFLLMEVVLWRSILGDRLSRFERPAFVLCALGVAVAGAAALSGRGAPVLSHYIPYLRNGFFAAGFVLFAGGMALMALPAMLHGMAGASRSALFAGAGVSAAAVVAVLLSIIITGLRLAGSPSDPEVIIKALFWGSGHILQFAHVAAMVTVWHLLLSPLGGPFGSRTAVTGLLLSYLPGVVAGLWGVVSIAPLDLLVNPFMTNVMAYGLGVPTGGVALLILLSLMGSGVRRRLWSDSALVPVMAGLITFATGGFIAIKGLVEQNLRIPAHYHGVLGAVALGFMGLTYHILARYFRHGFSEATARWQPYVYLIGVLGFVGGMGWAGVHGAPRKTPGFDWVHDPVVFIAMNLMGVGALFAAVGGAAYVWNTGRALLAAASSQEPASGKVIGEGVLSAREGAVQCGQQ